ncbi:hypothetical protein AB0F03_37455 [Streptomyces sp. NPDC028722]|uniref:hypothetical protein n=1 Tax=Streptomyces sp. NPDC028722 TaxID=3155016 RepID=UPI00340E54C7
MNISSQWGTVPFITQRKGEDPAPDNLVIRPLSQGWGHRLAYRDEHPRDRPLREILWARCAFSTDDDGLPTGEPMWKLMHVYRQMATMLAGRCQVCTRPARTPLGWIFVAGPQSKDPQQASVLTLQPPVCRQHVRTTEKLCPHMGGNPMVFLARSAPLYGVLGTVYGIGPRGGVQVVSRPAARVRFDDPRAPMLLGSTLVRRLSSFRVLDVDELLATLEGDRGR